LVATLAPGSVRGIAAGLHALVELPAGISETEACGAAAAQGLAITGLETYRTGPAAHGPALIVGYATPPEHDYRAAVAALARAIGTTDSHAC
jgi:GntR family transcriptional regulator/MocR family aminotransferase